LTASADWGNPRSSSIAWQGKLALGGLGFFAVAIIAAMVGFLVHEWRLPGEPTTPHSRLERAVKTFRDGDNRAALTVFTELAEQNNPVAQYWLGHMTELGLGASPDLPKAIDLYKKAAARGVVAAESRLGEAYLRGDVALPDFAQAKSYLERAAQRGDARAAWLLGHMYRIGLGVPADPKEAYAWSEVATIEGSPFARGERDRSLNDLSGGDQQAAVARARCHQAPDRRRPAANLRVPTVTAAAKPHGSCHALLEP
jgi:Sel1 repeat